MTEVVEGPRRRRDPFVFGIVLVVIGLVAVGDQLWQPTADIGGLVMLAIGLGLVAAFAYTRQYGYLVPGGIVTGIGAGVLVSQTWTVKGSEAEGGVVTLGLALGFFAIWAIAEAVHLERRHWWPIVPGTILGIVGSALLVGGDAVRVLDYWGIGLVVVGLFVMWRTWADRAPSGRAPSDRAPAPR